MLKDIDLGMGERERETNQEKTDYLFMIRDTNHINGPSQNDGRLAETYAQNILHF